MEIDHRQSCLKLYPRNVPDVYIGFTKIFVCCISSGHYLLEFFFQVVFLYELVEGDEGVRRNVSYGVVALVCQ